MSPKAFIESKSFTHETRIISTKAIIISASYILSWIPTYIGNTFIGYDTNSDLMLSAIGLSRTFCNITAVSIAWGLCSGLYTLVPQSIGSNRMDLLKQYIQRSFCITFICCLPLVIIQIYCAQILRFLGLSIPIGSKFEHIINISSLCFIPHIFASLWSTILRRIGQSFNHNTQILICNIITSIVSYPLCYYLLLHLEIVIYISIPLSISICSLIKFILMLCVLCINGHSNIFKPLPLKEIFKFSGVKDYLSLSLPGVVKNSFEWWFYELMVIICSYVTSVEHKNVLISSAVIIENILIIVRLIGYGIGNSTTIRIGKYIGKNKLFQAKRSMRSGLMINILTFTALSMFFYFYGYNIIYVFTNNEEIINLILNGNDFEFLKILIFIFTFILLLQLLSAIYRGIGKPKYSAFIIFVCYYIISLPIIIILLKIGIISNQTEFFYIIWFMFGVANSLAVIIMTLYLIFGVNWESVIDETQNRLSVKNEKTPISRNNDDQQRNYGSMKGIASFVPLENIPANDKIINV